MKNTILILCAILFASCSTPEITQAQEQTAIQSHDSIPERLIGEWASNMQPDKMVAKIEANHLYLDMSRKGLGIHDIKLSELKSSKLHYNSYELKLPDGNTITIGWNIDPAVTIIIITYTLNGESICVDWLIIYTPNPVEVPVTPEPIKEKNQFITNKYYLWNTQIF